MQTYQTDCCIVGGGPAGLMLGYMLARAGVPVIVLEKHADFLRDFRGDTIHPSTMEILHQLGDLPAFLQLPHTKFDKMTLDFEGMEVTIADFATLKVTAPFIAMMPQWDFLDFLADRAKTYPNFRLIMQAEVEDLQLTKTQITGVSGRTPDGPFKVDAKLTIAADGRSSILRDKAGMKVLDFGTPIDVLWFRLSRKEGDSRQSLGRARKGKLFVMLNRGDYWQVAHVVAKGSAQKIRDAGLDAFRATLDATLGLEPERSAQITDWDQVKLLSVQVNRLETWWREGLLFIGDAAHAMSPIGGIGINVAIQDAVATANLLVGPLQSGTITTADLARVQARRMFPVKVTQALQVMAQNRILAPALNANASKPPLPFRILNRFPFLRRYPARIIGLGIRRESVGPEFL